MSTRELYLMKARQGECFELPAMLNRGAIILRPESSFYQYLYSFPTVSQTAVFDFVLSGSDSQTHLAGVLLNTRGSGAVLNDNQGLKA
jgi:hypothetical protein